MSGQASDAEWVAQQKPAMVEFGKRNGYLRARLRLLPTSEGGRRHRIGTGFRAMWHFGERTADGLEVMHDAPLLIEGDWLEPGDEADVRLHPLFPDLWPKLRPGDTFEFREGERVLGYATYLDAVAPTSA